MSLPLADPEFWLVTAGAAAALVYALRKALRSARSESEVPYCDKCPKPGLAAPPQREKREKGAKRAVVALLALLVAPAARAATVERELASMGTVLRLTIDDARGRAAALALAERAGETVALAEERLSTWRDDSELERLNRAPVGEWLAVSPGLAAELRAATACAAETEDAFDPGIGSLVAVWGLRDGGRLPGERELTAARRTSGAAIEWSEPGDALRKRREFLFEEGAFGKGAALDEALDAVRDEHAASVRLDLGGQLAWSRRDGAEEIVELADPRHRGRGVLALRLSGSRSSVATSGDGERRFEIDGRRFGHLLDPRTGSPAADFGSVTVVAPRALRADCLATALFVMGPEGGAVWLRSVPRGVEVAYLVAEGARLRALLTPGLAKRARALVDGLVIEVLEVDS